VHNKHERKCFAAFTGSDVQDHREHGPCRIAATVARQRIALAHLILKSSSLILADEPTSALDHVDADLVIAILAEQSAHGCTRLISTHSDHIARLCDRSIALVGQRTSGSVGHSTT